jgi:hypothetical protein
MLNYKVPLFAGFLLSIILSSCSKNPEIVGKWHREGEPGAVTEFFKDGTYVSSGKPPGTYELLDGGKRLKMTVGGAFTFVLDGVEFDGKKLKGAHQGNEVCWVRAKN